MNAIANNPDTEVQQVIRRRFGADVRCEIYPLRQSTTFAAVPLLWYWLCVRPSPSQPAVLVGRRRTKHEIVDLAKTCVLKR